MQNPFAGLTPSQTWEEHLANAGPTLGGVDYAMAVGTPLPVLSGVLEWVTPATPVAQRPAWYNTGLGNAAAYRRPDGTRTVYGHCSKVRADGVVLSGNTGKVTGDGHVHVHDVLADGTTRARPFSTGGGAGGFAPPLEEEMKLIQANNRGAALVGAGYYKTVTEEERDGLLKVGVELTAFSEREFDVVKAACTNGYGPPVILKSPGTDTATAVVDVAELARQLAPLLPDAVTEQELLAALGRLGLTIQ